MRLDEYLSLNNIGVRAFARIAGLGVATVVRARDGVGIGNRRTLQAIINATDGAVTASDLVETAMQDHTDRGVRPDTDRKVSGAITEKGVRS
ncbi:hypothetical protein [Phaeobacter sp. Ax4a-4a]|uniref:hypothetical protein n=1 Tax=Phaeobacter sp. Ax4a-4a TaxID=3112437 RepID=UPI003A89580A